VELFKMVQLMNTLKRIQLPVSLLLYSFCASQQVNFTINGHLQNKSESKKVFLMGEINKELFLDSNNNFTYTGSLTGPGILLLKTENSGAWAVWINEGEINVVMQEYYLDGANTTGRKLLRFTSLEGPAETVKNQWFVDYRNNLVSKFNHIPINQRPDTVNKYYYPVIEEYVLNHPDTKFSAHLISLSGFDTDRKNKLLNLLNRQLNAEEAKRIEKIIARERLLKPGNILVPFQQQTLAGKSFSLSSLRDQYVLLEFWAHDCIPCRRANPELVKIYNQYHNKGFEIVGISLDNSKDAWEKAVKNDKLPWIQVSDLKGWDNKVASQYLIGSIPFNILIDKNRKILATNLTGELLSQKLNDLLKMEVNR
jgi:thiol-disulfide isomerase/thioredoxin